MKIVVYLQLKIKQFSARDEYFELWRNKFPQVEVIHAETREQYEAALPACQGAVVWAFKQEDYARAPKLRFVLTPAAGKDWLADDPQARVKTFFSRFHGPMIAESLLAGLLAVNNSLFHQCALQQQGQWDRNSTPGRRLLRGRKVLIYGFGNIGLHCARLLSALGMSVCGVNRSGRSSSDEFPVLDLTEAKDQLSQTDIIVSLIPRQVGAAAVFDKPFFEQVQRGAIFANFGRGSTVDEDALIEALDQEQLSSAVLDVTAIEPLPTNSPLYTHQRVLLTPHNSCCYEEYIPLFVEEWAERLEEEGLLN